MTPRGGVGTHRVGQKYAKNKHNNARIGPENTPNPPPKEKIPQGEQPAKGPWRTQGGPEAPAKVKKEPKHTKKPPISTNLHQNTQNNHKTTENTSK